MFGHSEEVCPATAESNKNIPVENGAINLDENTCGEIENILDHLLCKEEPTGVSYKPKIEQEDPVKAESSEIKYDDEYYTDTSDDWSDDSDSEIEYPAGFVSSKAQQSKTRNNHETEIIDLPQFILVFTAFKAEDTLIIPPNDLLPEYVQVENEYPLKKVCNSKLSDEKSANREIIKKHKALINRKIIKNEDLSKIEKEVTTPKHVHRIKYVRYSTPMDVIQREREIQANSNEQRTNEASVQCDLEEASEPTKEDSSQLEWINHIIEAHVLNDDGDMYECHICGETAVSHASKERHSLIHKECSSLCFQCGLYFRTPAKLKSHEKSAHQENTFEIKKALRCPRLYCTKAFHSKKQLFKHIDGHTKKTEQRCSKCQRTFSSFFQYHMHKSKRNCWR